MFLEPIFSRNRRSLPDIHRYLH